MLQVQKALKEDQPLPLPETSREPSRELKIGSRLRSASSRRRCRCCCCRRRRCCLLPPASLWSHLLPSAGENLALEELGPLIVTSNGALRRISNWAQLSEAERKVALRRVASRNRERLATLEEQQAASAASSHQQQVHQILRGSEEL